MSNSPIITLTTDFGYEDPFVGVIKGVILTINPVANIIDLTHGIKPQDIREAALTIGMSYEFFPDGTIHIVVVDPGVGSSRRPIIVMADRHFFVGPDNGVFSHIYNISRETLQVINISSEHYFLSPVGSTFQGRDIFAPTAAHLSKGINISNFGDPITDFHTIPLPFPQMRDGNTLHGEVIYIDRFGNAITNIRTSEIDKLYSGGPEGVLKVIFNGKEIPLKNFYSQVDDRNIYSLINSSGYLEIFVYRGSASSEYCISIGDTVDIILTEKPAL